jgi:hypothetical protein
MATDLSVVLANSEGLKEIFSPLGVAVLPPVPPTGAFPALPAFPFGSAFRRARTSVFLTGAFCFLGFGIEGKKD